jgi:uncharacterized protein YaiL (DUF2058 family)
MADSLQDQLRALGLAKKKAKKRPAKKAAKPRARSTVKKAERGGEVSLDRAYALRRREEQKQADRARKKKQAEDRQRREINRAIKAIVEAHRKNSDQADISRHFMFRDRIRKLYVTREQQNALGEGRLGIVYLSGGYHLLEPEQLAAVRKVSADHVVELPAGEDGEGDHPVPDDVVW